MGSHTAIIFLQNFYEKRLLNEVRLKYVSKYTGWPKITYSCSIKREMYNKRGFFKNEICLDCQCANLNFDILVLIFGCHLAYECLKSHKCFENCPKWGKQSLSM